MMWAVGAASILISVISCRAEDTPKWSKPASENARGDWVPLTADQLGQASARSLTPPQQNHLIHGIFQQPMPTSFAQPFHQQSPYHSEDSLQPNKYRQPHIFPPQTFLQSQIPSHLIPQQLPPQFLNQQFQSTFRQPFRPEGPTLQQQYINQDHLVREPVINQNSQKPPYNDYVQEQGPSNFRPEGNSSPQHSYTLTQNTPSAKVNSDYFNNEKIKEQEKEEVQILYVPVETLKQRNRGLQGSKITTADQSYIQQDEQKYVPQKPKENKPFKHPIQPLKEQTPALHLKEYKHISSNSGVISKNSEEPRAEYDSYKDTSQQISTSQVSNQEELYQNAHINNLGGKHIEAPVKQLKFKGYENEKEPPVGNVPNEELQYREFLQSTNRPLSRPASAQHISTEIYQDVTTKIPPPNQPPLSVYMDTTASSKIGDVLSLLKHSKTIPVLDTIGVDSPQVFIGPSSLKPPHGYVKFELPYLSSLDGNRVERKVLQLPFFVAPLNFQPPPGYSKIPFPPPHIGSVVLSNISAKSFEEKGVTPLPPYTPSPAFDPYTIPADISSISPQLPSLINSLQEENIPVGTTIDPPKEESRPDQKQHYISTEEATESTTSLTDTRKRRPHFRTSSRDYSSYKSSSARRPSRQRQRRPSVRRTTTTTTEKFIDYETYDNQSNLSPSEISDAPEQHISQNQQIHHISNQDIPIKSKNTGYVNKQNNDESISYYSLRPSDEVYHKPELLPNTKSDIDHYYKPTEEIPINSDEKYVISNGNIADINGNPENLNLQHQKIPQVFDSGHVHRQQTFSSQFPISQTSFDRDRPQVNQEVRQPELTDTYGPTTQRNIFNSPSGPLRQREDEKYVSISDYPVSDYKQKPQDDHILSLELPGKSVKPKLPVEFNNEYSKQFPDTSDRGGNYDSYVHTTPTVTAYTEPTLQYRHEVIKEEKPLDQYPFYQQTKSVIPPGEELIKSSYNINDQEQHKSSKQRLRGRPVQDQKPADEENVSSHTEQVLETTTTRITEKPTQTRFRGRVRGRPLYPRQKTSTEPPNYPTTVADRSNTENHAQRDSSSQHYTISTQLGKSESGSSSDYARNRTQPIESTNRLGNKKYSVSRTVNRRPVRPTSGNSPTTTQSPSGVKYLIRTRRPTSSQTKLHIGRSRIRKPTTTTTESTTSLDLTWPVTQNPKNSYQDNIGEKDLSYSPLHSSVSPQHNTFSRTPLFIAENEHTQSDNLYSSEHDEKSRPYVPKPLISQSEDHDSYKVFGHTGTDHQIFRQNNPSHRLSSYNEGDGEVLTYKSFETTRKGNLLKQRDHHSWPQNEPEEMLTSNIKSSSEEKVNQYRDSEPAPISPYTDEGRNGNYKSYDTSRHEHSYKQSSQESKLGQTEQENSNSNFKTAVPSKTKYRFKEAEYKPTQASYVAEEDRTTNHKSLDSTRKGLIFHQESHQPVYVPHSDQETHQKSNQASIRKKPHTVYEEKYIEENPHLIPDGQKVLSPENRQKEQDDFWDQAVTIQQSQSYVYQPDPTSTARTTPYLSRSALTQKQTPTRQDFSDYEDFFSYQDTGKFPSSDQSPFPSNDQQVTYTGLKPSVDLGKESQYPEKQKDDTETAKTEELTKEDSKFLDTVEPKLSVPQQSNDKEKLIDIKNNTESAPYMIENTSVKHSVKGKGSRRRGTWVRVRVKKPKDVFETAESQRFGSLTSNSFQKDDKANVAKNEWSSSKQNSTNVTTPPSEVPKSVYDISKSANATNISYLDHFQSTITKMIKHYLSKEQDVVDNVSTSTESVATEAIEITTINSPTDDTFYTTEQQTTLPVEDSDKAVLTTTETNIQTIQPTTALSEATPLKVLGTSTTTEISLETEICFRGRCVKTQRTKEKYDSDLMPVE